MTQLMSLDDFLETRLRRRAEREAGQPEDRRGSLDQFLDGATEERVRRNQSSHEFAVESLQRTNPLTAGNEFGGVAAGLANAGASIAAPLVRTVSGDGADWIQGQSSALMEAQQRNVQENVDSGRLGSTPYLGAARQFVNEQLPGAVSSLTQSAGLAASGGTAGLVLGFGAGAADQSYYEGRQAGLSKADAALYGARDAVAETLPMLVFQGLGKAVPALSGVEGLFTNPKNAQTIAGIVKNTAIGLGAEGIEESITTVAQLTNKAASIPGSEDAANWYGTDGEFLSETAPMRPALVDTWTQTFATMGLGKAIQLATNPADRKSVLDFAANASRRTYAGLTKPVKAAVDKMFPNALGAQPDRQAAAAAVTAALSAEDQAAEAEIKSTMRSTDELAAGQPADGTGPIDMTFQNREEADAWIAENGEKVESVTDQGEGVTQIVLRPEQAPDTAAVVPPAVIPTNQPPTPPVPLEVNTEPPVVPSASTVPPDVSKEAEIVDTSAVPDVFPIQDMSIDNLEATLDWQRQLPEEELIYNEDELRGLRDARYDIAGSGSVQEIASSLGRHLVDAISASESRKNRILDGSELSEVSYTELLAMAATDEAFRAAEVLGVSREELSQRIAEWGRGKYGDDAEEMLGTLLGSSGKTSVGSSQQPKIPVQPQAETGSMPGGQQAQEISEVRPPAQEPTASQPPAVQPDRVIEQKSGPTREQLIAMPRPVLQKMATDAGLKMAGKKSDVIVDAIIEAREASAGMRGTDGQVTGELRLSENPGVGQNQDEADPADVSPETVTEASAQSASPALQSETKEPWQMTREEFEATPEVRRDEDGRLNETTEEYFRRTGGDAAAFVRSDVKTPGIVYRGLSRAELKRIIRTGQVKSSGRGNIGEAQKEQTLFSEMPSQAASYASNFTMKGFRAKSRRPGYVIEVSRPENATVNEQREIEVGDPIASSEIKRVWELRPRHSGSSADYLIRDITDDFKSGTIQQHTNSPHREAVQEALAAGKPVPENVLAEYPDLVPETSQRPEWIDGETEKDLTATVSTKPVMGMAPVTQTVYHGTRNGFNKFRRMPVEESKSVLGAGIWFTADQDEGGVYASSDPFVNVDISGAIQRTADELEIPYIEAKKLLKKSENPSVKSASLKMTSPMIVSNTSKIEGSEGQFKLAANEAGVELPAGFYATLNSKKTTKDQIDYLIQSKTGELVTRLASIKGHDGIVFQDSLAPRSKADQFVVFDPELISDVKDSEFVDGRNYFAPKALRAAEEESGSYKSREMMISISPDEFLTLAEKIDSPSSDKQKTVSDVLGRGEKLNSIPFLGFVQDQKGTAQVVGHEGRHRAMALKERGVKKMPVMLRSQGIGEIRWSEQSNKNGFDRIKGEWPTVLKGQTSGEIVFPIADPAIVSPESEQSKTPVVDKKPPVGDTQTDLSITDDTQTDLSDDAARLKIRNEFRQKLQDDQVATTPDGTEYRLIPDPVNAGAYTIEATKDGVVRKVGEDQEFSMRGAWAKALEDADLFAKKPGLPETPSGLPEESPDSRSERAAIRAAMKAEKEKRAAAKQQPTKLDEDGLPPKYSVYEQGVKDRGTMYAVRGDGKRGTGDQLYETREQAEQGAIEQREREERDAVTRARREEKEAAQELKDAAEKAEYEDVDGFASDKPAMKQGAVRKVLNKQKRYDGRVMKSKEMIRESVAKGRFVSEKNGKPALEDSDGSYRQLNQTEAQYAQYLIDRPAVSNDPVPTPKPKSERRQRDDQRVADSDAKVKAAQAKFKAKMGKLGINSGLPVDPEAIMATLELTEALVEAGIVRFNRFVNNVIEFMGEEWVRRNKVYLEEGWSLAAEDDSRLDQPTDIATLLGEENDDAIASKKTNESVSDPVRRKNAGSGRVSDAGRTDADRGTVRDGDGGRDDSTGQDTSPEQTEDSSTSKRRKSSDNNEERDAVSVPTGDVRLDPQTIGSGGAKTKYKNNVAAIKLLKQLELEQRLATTEEQQVLAQYVGWGMFPGVFNNLTDKAFEGLTPEQRAEQDPNKWAKERDEVKSLLTTEEWESAADSTINAHYTSPEVVQGMWSMLDRMGFQGGRVVETSAGSGNFIGFQPESMKQQSDWTAVEMDKLTGGILRNLYPSANTHIMPYQDFAAPDGFYDLAIGNVPFSNDIKVLSDKRYKKQRPNLHDYFFLKTLDKVRPGGLVAFITSTGTLDKQSKNIRTALGEKANLVGAFRLPGTAFKKNAGTEVTTDMIILQKLPEGEQPSGASWMDIGTLPDPDRGAAIPVNEYFRDNPENILGRLDRRSKLYGPGQPNVSGTDDFQSRWERAIESVPEDIYQPWKRDDSEQQQIKLLEQGEAKEGQYLVRDGKLYFVDNGVSVPVKQSEPTGKKATDTKRMNEYNRKVAHVRDVQPLREAVVERINAMLSGATEAENNATKEKLNATYDDFVSKHGPINSNKTFRRKYKSLGAVRKSLMDDVDWPLLASLEIWDADNNSVIRKADIFTEDTIRNREVPTSADSLTDAIGFSLNETGKLNIDRVAELLSKTPEDVGQELVKTGQGFNDPAAGWVAADEYLSGNVRQKLREAKLMAKTDKQYEANIKALEAVQPEDIPAEDIYARPGAPWLPVESTIEFVSNLLGVDASDVDVKKLELTGETTVRPSKTGAERLTNSAATIETWGTSRANFFRLWDVAATGVPIVIRDRFKDGTSKVNQEETEAANAKAEEIKEEFQEWLFSEPERRELLARTYNEVNNALVESKNDGSHLQFPGMLAEGMELASEGRQFMGLRPHQKNAVWRVIQRGRGLLAHEVGTGKTMSMVASAMELRRLGLARKPSIIVPNSRVDATVREAQDLYPGARILSASKGMTKAKRRQTVAQIATGDYDIVVLTHENLMNIPVSPALQTEYFNREVEELRSIVLEEGVNPDDDAAMQTASRGNAVVKRLRQRILKLRERLAELAADRDPGTTFDETGIDFMFVDEAHNFKQVPIRTRMGTVKGIPSGDGSKRAENLDMISSYISGRNNGRGIVLATGTPVTNSMAELFVMQNFIQKKELAESGLQSFDAWASAFGETVTKMEFDHTGGHSISTRFTRFVNIPELRKLAFQDIDYVRAEDDPVLAAALKRPDRNDREVVSPATSAQTRYLESLGMRARALKGPPEKGGDNHLNIATDGTKAAMDLRLVMHVEEEAESKAQKLVAEITRINDENPGTTQMVFMEKSKSNETGFDVIEDIIGKLVSEGIPRDKILDFRGSITPQKKDQMISRLKEGDAIVAFGNTKTLGTGVNAQDRLRAIHHFEPSWTPEAIEQRNGRGWRQGNGNTDLDIITYLSEGTLDSWRWQTVARKAKFIQQLFTGKTDARTMEDEDIDEVGGFERMQVLASGNPLQFEKMNLENDIEKLERGQERFFRQKGRLGGQIEYLQERVDRLQKRADFEKEQTERYELAKEQPFEAEITGKTYTTRKDAAIALATKFIPMKASTGIDKMLTYRGFTVYRRGVRRALHNDVVSEFIAVPDSDGSLSDDRQVAWPDPETLSAADPSSFFRSLDGQLRNIVKSHPSVMKTSDGLTSASDDIKQLRDDRDRPWRSLEKLTKKRSRLALVSQALEEGLKSTSSLMARKQTKRPASPLDDKGRQPPQDGNLGYSERSSGGSRPTGRRGPVTTPEEQSGEDAGPVSHTSVSRRLEKIWDATIKAGRVPASMLGSYQQSSGKVASPHVVRVIKAQIGNLGLLSHEIAHHIDQVTDVLDGLKNRAIWKELRGLDYKPGRADKKVARKEGFAEYVRMWMTAPDTGPNSAMMQAPQFTEYFEKWLKKHPDVAKKMADSRKQVRSYYNQSVEQRVASQIKESSTGDRPADETALELLIDKTTGWKENFEKDFVNQYAPVKKLMKLMKESGYKWSANESSTYDLLMAFTNASPQHAERAVQYGIHTVSKNDRILGRGLVTIVADSGVKEGKDYEAAIRWIYARHAEELHSRKPDYNAGITVEDAQQILADTSAADAARYEKLGDGLTEFSNQSIAMLVDAGVISQEEADAIIEAGGEFYVPLIRVTDESQAKSLGGGGLINMGKPLKRRSTKGSDAPIMDPILSMLNRTQHFYSTALKQQVVQQLATEIRGTEGAGSLMHEVIPNKKVTAVRVADILADKTVQAEMARVGIVPSMYDGNDDLMTAIVNIFRPDFSGNKDENVVRLMVDGKPKLYWMNPALYESLDGMPDIMRHPFIRILGGFTRAVRMGAVGLNPVFAAANVQRDWRAFQERSRNTSGVETVTSPFYWLGSYVKHASGKGGRNEMARLYEEFGGLLATRFGTGDRQSVDIRDISLNLSPEKKSTSLIHRTRLKASRYGQKVENFVAMADVGPRLAEFAGVLKKHGFIQVNGVIVDTNKGNKPGRPPRHVMVEAINAASEATVNFKIKGRKAQILNQMIPFLTASIASLNKQYRVVRGAYENDPTEAKRMKVVMANAGAAALTVVYMMMRGDDDDYEEQPDWLKYGYWTFTMDGKPLFRLSKGYEESFVPNAVEGIINSMNSGSRKDFLDSMYQTFHKTMLPYEIAAIAGPAEVAMNYDTFRQQPIENQSLTGRSTVNRSNEWTSEFAKALSTYGGQYIGLSPVEIDHLMGKQTGGLLPKVIGGVEGVLTGDTQKMSRAVEVLNPLSAFHVRKDYTRSINDVYERQTELNQELGDLKFKGQEPTVELQEERSKLSRVTRLFSSLRDVIDAERDRDERFKVEQYMTGLARWATGESELERYPNPWKLKDMPTDVRAVIEDEMMKVIEHSIIESTSKNESYRQSIDSARTFLKESGVSSAQAMTLLSQYYRSKPLSRDRYTRDQQIRDRRDKRALLMRMMK